MKNLLKDIKQYRKVSSTKEIKENAKREIEDLDPLEAYDVGQHEMLESIIADIEFDILRSFWGKKKKA